MSENDELQLEQLGAHAKAHILKGDKAKDKADQHYISAGAYLKQAHEQVSRTKDLDWPTWLQQNVNIGKSRSYDLIAIADGRKTVDEVRADAAARQSAYRNKAKDRPSRNGRSNEIAPRNQPEDLVEQARQASGSYTSTLRSMLDELTDEQAKAVLEFIRHQLRGQRIDSVNDTPAPSSRGINDL